jgi:outer membrane protein OmpA-like peptidoglycan-associated protein
MFGARARFCGALLAVGLAACSKSVAFRGDTTLAITGKPPPAPPPVAVEPPRVEVRDNKIAISQKIQFAYDRADILPVSHDLLNEVVAVIQKNPQLRKIQIEGHASADGEARHNMQLSAARAKSVLTYLVQKGIAKDRLLSKGYGIDKPIADNSTKEGREANRRVEMNIIEQEITTRRVEIDKTGKEKVIEEKKQTLSAGS